MSRDVLVKIPQLQQMFRFQWEAAQQCYVLLYPEGMVKLNGPAGEVLALVDGQRSVASIVTTLEEKFSGVDLTDDVLQFLQEAQEQQWITYPDEASPS